jgi:hypothetical protein
MDNVNDKQLSFPQRNWLLLCILVAILSPILVHLLQTGAQKENYRDAITAPPPKNAAAGTDTSYKMNNPPGNDTSVKTGAGGAAAGKASVADSSGAGSKKP